MTINWQAIDADHSPPKDGSDVLLRFPGAQHPYFATRWVRSEHRRNDQIVSIAEGWEGLRLVIVSRKAVQPSHFAVISPPDA